MTQIEIFTDGCYLGNPGPGGWAALIRKPGKEKPISGNAARTTNNRMELIAAIKALEALKKPLTVTVYSDSQYLTRGITEYITRWKANGWRTAHNKDVLNTDLWVRLDNLCQTHSVTWQWVKGHSGHPENERVDQEANRQAALV